MHTTYTCMVVGQPPKVQRTLVRYYQKHEGKPAGVKGQPYPHAKELNTGITLLPTQEPSGLSRLDIVLYTGRTHQIRVHMKSVHHPVAGDPIYGQKKGVKVSRLMLHAFSLCFTHPYREERMCLEAPLPEEFLKNLRKLRGCKMVCTML